MINHKPFTHILRGISISIFTASISTLAVNPAHAFSIGKYRVNNHPDGNAAPPAYCLRLDGLVSGNSSDIYTFNCENSQSEVFLEYDGSSVTISGKVFGGLDVGSSYDNPVVWDLDFTYNNVTTNGDGLVVWGDGQGQGNISSTVGSYDLFDYKGVHDYSFKIDTDHRGEEGYSGWGWLNHADEGTLREDATHLYASDWLFTVEKVPEPSAVLGLAFIAGFAALKRRQSR